MKRGSRKLNERDAKSYKMVVLSYMLSRGIDKWLDPVTSEEVAPFFHQYLTEKDYRKRIDFSDKGTTKLWEYDEKEVAKLIAEDADDKVEWQFKGSC